MTARDVENWRPTTKCLGYMDCRKYGDCYRDLSGAPFSLLKLNTRSSANEWGLNSSIGMPVSMSLLLYVIGLCTCCTDIAHVSSTNQPISRMQARNLT